MRIILFVLLSLIAFIAKSTSTTQFENKLFYCPEQISCDEQGDCTFVSEYKNLFKYLVMPNIVEIGIYKFQNTLYLGSRGTSRESNWPKEQFTYNQCSYLSLNKVRIDLIIYNGNNLQALNENWTSWSNKAPFVELCESSMSSKCPLIKNEGIIVERFMRNESGEILRYNDTEKTPITVDVKVNKPGTSNPAQKLWQANHQELVTNCKSATTCKLTILYATAKDRVYHQSDIIIDLSNNDQIIDIIPSSGKSDLTVKVNPIVPNTIQFEYHELPIKKEEIKYN